MPTYLDYAPPGFAQPQAQSLPSYTPPSYLDYAPPSVLDGLPAGTLEASRQHAATRDPIDTEGDYMTRRAIPFVSSINNAIDSVTYGRAKTRIKEGRGSSHDHDLVHAYEAQERHDSERGLGGQIVSGLAHLPAIAGEAILGGSALRGVGLVGTAPSVGRALVSPAAWGRNLAQTAVMPSMWLQPAAERAARQGGEIYEPHNLAPAVAMGFLNTAVLGSLGGFGNSITRTGVMGAAQRTLVRTASGMMEQQGIDVLASAISEVLPEMYKMETSYGIGGQLLQGKGGDALRNGLIQAVNFGAFSVMHGFQKPHEVSKTTKEILKEAREQNLSDLQAGEALIEHVNQMQRLHETEHQSAQGPEPGIDRLPEPRAPGAQPPPAPPQGDVFSRMPPEVLQRQAKLGVQGAQQELLRRQNSPPMAQNEPIAAQTPPEVAAAAKEPVPEPQAAVESRTEAAKPELTPAQRQAEIAQLTSEQAADAQRQATGKTEPRKRTYGPNDLPPEVQRAIDESPLSKEHREALEFILSGGSTREAKKTLGISHEWARQRAKKAFKDLKETNPNFLPEYDTINDFKAELAIQSLEKLAAQGENVSAADLGNVAETGGRQVAGSHETILDALVSAEETASIYEKELEDAKRSARSIGRQTRSREDVSRSIAEALAESLKVAEAQRGNPQTQEPPRQATPAGQPLEADQGNNRGTPPVGAGESQQAASPVGQPAQNPLGASVEPMPAVEHRTEGGTMGTGRLIPEESNKNLALGKEKVAETRLEEGLAKIEKQAAQGDEMIWNQARQAVATDPGAATRLAHEVVNSNGQRALNTTEKAMVLHRMIAVRNELSQLIKKSLGGEAASMSDYAYAQLKNRTAELKMEREVLDKASDLAGSESGRSLRIQRLLAKYDYSLDGLTRGREEAKRAPLSPAETKEIERLHDKIKELQDKLDANQDRSRNSSTGNLAQRLAKEAVEKGITDREKVIDYVHDALTTKGFDLDRRETMDAISGYGKYTQLNMEDVAVTLRDLKGQMQQLGKLEDMAAGQAPLKTGGERRTPSAEERALIKQVNEAKKKGGYDVVDPATQLKTALDAVKTRLRNQMEDLQRSIDSKEPLVKEKTGLKYDEETERLVLQRDQLKKQYEDIFGKAEMTPEQRLKLAMEAVGKSIVEWDRRIKELDFSPKKIGESKTPKDAMLEAMRSRRDAMREELNGLKDAADQNMQRPPELIRNQAYKTATVQKIAELQERIAKGDFEKAEKKEPAALNAENLKLQAEINRARNEWKQGNLRLEAERRTPLEKTLAVANKWRRGFILSGVEVLAKLTSAGFMRPILNAVENVPAKLLGAAFPKAAEKATYEGPTRWSVEAKAIADGIAKAPENFMHVLKTGEMEIGHAYGKEKIDVDPSYADWFGRMHGALKSTAKQIAFNKANAKGLEAAAKQGLDITDPAVQMRIGVEAYKEGERAIFQNDNWITDRWKRALTPVVDPATGKESTSSVVQRNVAHALLPIVKVPTNIVFETFQHVFGAFTGSAQLAHAYAKGIESLKPAHADSIFRQLKKGSLGLATLALGLYLKDSVGGFYQRNEHRSEDEPGPGEIVLGGVKIPKFLLHHPLIEALQVGATTGRIADRHTRRGDDTSLPAAFGLAMLGLADEIPFVREMTHIGELTSGHPEHILGQEVKSLAVPQIVDWSARMMDRDSQGNLIRRRPDGVWEHIKSGIPVLRTQLPERLRR